MIVCVRNLTNKKLKLQKFDGKKKLKTWKVKPKGELYIKARPKEGFIGTIKKNGKFIFVKKERGIKSQTFEKVYIDYIEINQAGILNVTEK